VLGALVEKISGESLQEFTQRRVFRPLKMSETTYLPGEDLRKRAAPTERRGDEWLKGKVHDPRANKLGGIAGHAGLFSTANDLALYADALLRHGEGIMQKSTWLETTKPRTVPGRDNNGKP